MPAMRVKISLYNRTVVIYSEEPRSRIPRAEMRRPDFGLEERHCPTLENLSITTSL